MSEDKHTPLPWAIRPNRFDDWGYIRGANGDVACCARGADDKSFDEHRRDGTDPYAANAALIVRSVNSLPALVKALEEIANTFGDSWMAGCLERRIGDKARGALAAYRGESK